MLQFEELRQKLMEYEEPLLDLAEALGLGALREKAAELEETTSAPDFWNDLENSQATLKKISQMKNKIGAYDALKQTYDDTLMMISLADEEGDASMLPELTDSAGAFIKELDNMRLSTLLRGEYDAKNAILSLHAGAGGTESQDWALMLFRMLTRWAERRGFKVKTLDMLDGEEAGIKSAVFLVEGVNAYGYLKSEAGVHRLVRVSPFDSSGRRHTSFASVEVMPEIDDSVQVDIREEDLKVDTYRSGGAGGQHVNKTESAVRITHMPTGVVVACQNERSQHQNREVAMRMLKSKLIEIMQRAHLERIEDIKGEQKEIGWGSQIRSYVFMPYTLVKDHRTGFEVGNIGAVMDGDIDDFINAYLKAESLGQLSEFAE